VRGTLEYGQTVTDTVAAGEHHNWLFEGRAGDGVTITMTTSPSAEGVPFDGYLELYALDGQRLALDDDSAGDGRPRFAVFVLPSDGTYRIAALGYLAQDQDLYLALIRQWSNGGTYQDRLHNRTRFPFAAGDACAAAGGDGVARVTSRTAITLLTLIAALPGGRRGGPSASDYGRCRVPSCALADSRWGDAAATGDLVGWRWWMWPAKARRYSNTLRPAEIGAASRTAG
jgi:hypothetical protein